MENNPYIPPQANLSVQEQDDTSLYVVATRKFWLLIILTFGFYRIYWFYQNWKRYKSQTKSDIWPVPRAIFSVFFAHSLNGVVDRRLKRRELGFVWSPGMWATIYVVSTLIGNVADRLSMKDIGSPMSDTVGLFSLVVWSWAMWQTQLAINAAGDDPQGDTNSELTAANYAWIVLGCLLWLVVIYGFYILLTEGTP